ncbi:MAG: hypothetical protein U5J97_02100 [Trueperaceae bacterium]|nr:hypothetical protein [Trueperaceae bacterium]
MLEIAAWWRSRCCRPGAEVGAETLIRVGEQRIFVLIRIGTPRQSVSLVIVGHGGFGQSLTFAVPAGATCW